MESFLCVAIYTHPRKECVYNIAVGSLFIVPKVFASISAHTWALHSVGVHSLEAHNLERPIWDLLEHLPVLFCNVFLVLFSNLFQELYIISGRHDQIYSTVGCCTSLGDTWVMLEL